MDEFLKAIKENNIATAKTIIASDPAIVNKQPGAGGQTPLMIAYTDGGEEEIIKLLIQSGSNLELKDSANETVLFYAIRRAKEYDSEFWIQLLFEGSTPPDVNHKQQFGSTPLHEAVIINYYDGVEFLLGKGADPNIMNNESRTPLFRAAEEDDEEEIVGLLLKKGAKTEVVDTVTNYTHSALIFALRADADDNALALIDAGANVNAVDPSDEGEDDTPLIIAIRQDFTLDVIQSLIDKGADVNAKNAIEMSPLHVLAEMKDADVQVPRLLIEKGARLNDLDDGEVLTPLMHAVFQSNTPLVKLLLERGANKDVEDGDGNTALDIAKDVGDEEIIALLETDGAAPSGDIWKGYDKSDAQFFDAIVENDVAMNKKTLCPFCLQTTEWGTEKKKSCKYLTHKCKAELRHERLYNLYKDERGDVTWCAVCGRHCYGHGHFQLTNTNETVRPNLMPFKDGADVYKAESCPLEGGGGPDEKIRRIDGLLRYICEVQDQAGKRPAKEVHDELIEEAWKAASSRIPKTVQDIKTGLKFKTYCDLPTSLSATTNAADIPNPNPLPTKHEKEMCSINLEECDVYEFKHVQPDGTVFTHQRIGKDAIRDMVRNSGDTENKCPIEPECNGKLHPEEIKEIFADEPDVYNNYKGRFNDKNKQAGGAKGGSVTSPMDDVRCAIAEKKKGGRKRIRTYRKIKKSRRGKRNTYRRRL